MLTPDLNELLSRTARGTPMGELFRRFWLPAICANEIVADGSPVRLRIMHEELIAFRDSSGTPGVIEAFCSHRLAPLFYGRNEECGLRCPYHGWKFDVNGKCIDIPNVDQALGDRLKSRTGLTAYPVREAGGLLWVYMGPADKMPPFPRFEMTEAPVNHVHAARWLQRSNWMAGLEGEIDSAHISWLHKHFGEEVNPIGGGTEVADDGAPEITLRNTEYGFLYGSRRSRHEEYYWRVTHWLAPMFSLIPRSPGAFAFGGGRAWVPIDDDNVTCFNMYYRIDRPVSQIELDYFASGAGFPPRLESGAIRLGDRSPIDTFLPVANIDNDYLLDRQMQKDVNFSGIWGANEQDRALQESMRMAPGSTGIVDRSKEHLIESDRAVVTMRQRMAKLAKALSAGEEPGEPGALAQVRLRALSRMLSIADFDDLREQFADELVSDRGFLVKPGNSVPAE